jgi:Flp pilus assembly pilin Flp
MSKLFKGFVCRFRRDQSAAATVEFVMIAPLLFSVVFSVFESGWLMTKYMMLDRGLDMAVRELRLGIEDDPTHAGIVEKVCEYALILRDCEDILILDMMTVDAAEDIPATTSPCRDRMVEEPPASAWNTGARSEIVFVRACAIVDPIFPGMGLGLQLPKDASGGFALLASSVYVNEPE